MAVNEAASLLADFENIHCRPGDELVSDETRNRAQEHSFQLLKTLEDMLKEERRSRHGLESVAVVKKHDEVKELIAKLKELRSILEAPRRRRLQQMLRERRSVTLTAHTKAGIIQGVLIAPARTT